MKYSLILACLLLISGSLNITSAQQAAVAGPADTLVVLWSSGDPEVAEKACLMYANAANKYKWFSKVIVVVWGPSEKLLAENEALKYKISAMQQEGVIFQACVACANMYDVTDELKVCNVDVKGMGVPLTKYLKRGYKIISY